MLASHMFQAGACVARGSSLRIAPLALIATIALQCQSPGRDGLFQSSPLGSAGAANVSPGGTPADLPAGSGGLFVPGTGESAVPGEEGPPLSGVGGTAGQDPQSMGPPGAMDSPDASGVPATLDAGVAPVEDCVLGEFQAPEPLTGIEQGLNPALTLSLWSPSLSADGFTLFFAASSGADEQTATATRADRGAAFGRAIGVPEVSSEGQNGTPALSADGLTLYFYSTRGGGLGSRDLWLSTRSDTAAEFTTPTLIAGVNSPAFEHVPWVSPDELTLIWATDRSGGVGQGDIWIARRSFRSDGFSGVAPLNGVNSPSDETRAVLGDDGLTIYLSSNRPGGVGGRDLWVATRNDPADTFSQITNLAGVNSSSEDTDPALSADGRELMFASARDGSVRLWRSVRDCE
jgi:WD40-like Beta Propeller Repeat